jgi:hypothetical protein
VTDAPDGGAVVFSGCGCVGGEEGSVTALTFAGLAPLEISDGVESALDDVSFGCFLSGEVGSDASSDRAADDWDDDRGGVASEGVDGALGGEPKSAALSAR